MLTVLDLFSGVGAISYGLEQTGGFRTVAFCEIEPFPRAVLHNHWPGVKCYEDVKTLSADKLSTDGIVRVDCITAGFPCQDVSIAGTGAGLAGARSGLFWEAARIIGEVRPQWVLLENVAQLRSRGLDQVLGALASLGYDAEWHCIPASAIGAPHRRDRIWILGYANDVANTHNEGRGNSSKSNAWCGEQGARAGTDRAIGRSNNDVANSEGRGWGEHGHVSDQVSDTGTGQLADSSATVANAGGAGLAGSQQPGWGQPIITATDVRRSASQRRWGRAAPGLDGKVDGTTARMDRSRPVETWEGNTPRTVGKGFPNRRPRLKAIGNSVVPQIPELIGCAILARIALLEAEQTNG